jgi:Mrp family chromosome partitioning ATPase
VDLDLHDPTIEKFFDLEGHPGLTSVALGRLPLDAALVEIPIPWTPTPRKRGWGARAGDGTSENGHQQNVNVLELLPSGPLPPNPGEFVATQAVRSILEALRVRAEIVLIDSPPLLEMSDTLSLSGVVDGVVFVSRYKGARRPRLRHIRRVLHSTPTPTLGVVLTGIERDRRYGYGSYGSGASVARLDPSAPPPVQQPVERSEASNR